MVTPLSSPRPLHQTQLRVLVGRRICSGDPLTLQGRMCYKPPEDASQVLDGRGRLFTDSRRQMDTLAPMENITQKHPKPWILVPFRSQIFRGLKLCSCPRLRAPGLCTRPAVWHTDRLAGCPTPCHRCKCGFLQVPFWGCKSQRRMQLQTCPHSIILIGTFHSIKDILGSLYLRTEKRIN